jgi:hypothetical protein
LAREIDRARIEANLTSEDLMLALREERERYCQETYGATAASEEMPEDGDAPSD